MTISLSAKAQEEIRKIVEEAGDECAGIRVRALKLGRYTFRYQLHLVKAEHTEESDEKIDCGSFSVYVDPQSVEWMKDSVINFVTDETGSGMHIDNPAANPSWEDPLAQKVQKVVDETLLPALGQHGGWLELVKVEGDTAYIELGGGCQGCAGAQATMKEGIERMIKEQVPEITKVVDQTDHSRGQSPFQ